MKWFVPIAVALLLIPLLSMAIIASKKSMRGKGRMAGATLAIGIAFAFLFDPAKAAATETIEKKKEMGDSESRVGGELID